VTLHPDMPAAHPCDVHQTLTRSIAIVSLDGEFYGTRLRCYASEPTSSASSTLSRKR
jgi:hypothetical protein